MMHDAIEDILEKQDFAPLNDSADADLEVQLRAFEYDNICRPEDENRIVFIPFASENEKWLNEVANGLVRQIFKDRALLNHLAE